MTLLLKDPEATLDYSVDWGAEYLSGDALAESGWTVIPAEPDGIAVVSDRFDLLLCPVVESMTLTAPPPSPAPGACYLVASGGSDAWAGRDGMLAGYTDGGWRFIAPVEGMRVLDRSSGLKVMRLGGAWESGIIRAEEVRVGGLTVMRARQPAIADPAGGTVIDSQCRAAIGSILAMLRTHGLIAS